MQCPSDKKSREICLRTSSVHACSPCSNLHHKHAAFADKSSEETARHLRWWQSCVFRTLLDQASNISTDLEWVPHSVDEVRLKPLATNGGWFGADSSERTSAIVPT